MADAEHGFCRPEMFSEPLAGTAKATFARHIFVTWGTASAWPAELPDGCPEGSLPKVLEKLVKAAAKASGTKVKVTYVEADESLIEGDVLVFPDYVCIRGCAPGGPGLAALEALLSVEGKAHTQALDVEDVAGSFAFICAHASRDSRCGMCGPELAKALRGERLGAQGLRVLKCSHVGGHKFAGNIITFSGKGTKDDGHWYGYVTPSTVAAVVSGRAVRGPLWRGRLGLDEAGAVKERRVQGAKGAVFVVATAVVAAAAVFVALRLRRRDR